MINEIVPTNANYNSFILRQNLNSLVKKFPFINLQIVGNSVLGTPLYVVRLGVGKKKVFYSASFHANEWITSVLLMKFIEDYCNLYINNSSLYGYSVRNLFNTVSIYLMPMVNPDGITLILLGLLKLVCYSPSMLCIIGTFVVTPLHLLLHLYIYKFRLAY